MSYFNHPVKAAVFEAAMPGLCERLLRTAGKQEEVCVQVIFTGRTASAIWRYRLGKVWMTIRLPALAAGSMIDREKANRWVAYVIHEVWHVIFTDSDVWQQYARYFPGLRRNLANALEDARIERAGMALGYAAGFNVVGKELLAHLLLADGMDVNPNDPRQVPWVFAVGCRGYGVRGERRLLSALDPRIAAIMAEAKRRIHAVPVTATPREGTTASCEIASWAFEELKKLGQAQPLTQYPEEGFPGQQQEQEKQPHRANDDTPERDESEREQGSADDESYDDEGDPQEGKEGDRSKKGKPDPLKVGDKVKCPDGSIGVISEIVADDAVVAAL